ncbi:hypothetical protein DL98DRAFT_525494 [Cadophora sp. DSE1049]|nr:hypothetical protein DL98DRAFT_525494 [Cadophora sp. DSE1049]
MIPDLKQCSIGYWLFMESCNTQFAKRSIEPILTSPTLNTFQKCFPMKAEFFENIQQADFWEACIALYGWSALHARTLIEGVKIEFSGLKSGNRLGKIYELSYDRIYDQNSRVNEFRATLHEYLKRCGPQLNGVERRNLQIGRAIIKNSIFEEDFWETTMETRQFLGKVVDTLRDIWQDAERTTKSTRQNHRLPEKRRGEAFGSHNCLSTAASRPPKTG